jgi:hypothetical protein
MLHCFGATCPTLSSFWLRSVVDRHGNSCQILVLIVVACSPDIPVQDSSSD